MALKEIKRKVVSYCEIPEEISSGHDLLEQASCDTYMEFHLDDNPYKDPLDAWIRETYPELIDEESFLIHIDY